MLSDMEAYNLLSDMEASNFISPPTPNIKQKTKLYQRKVILEKALTENFNQQLQLSHNLTAFMDFTSTLHSDSSQFHLRPVTVHCCKVRIVLGQSYCFIT